VKLGVWSEIAIGAKSKKFPSYLADFADGRDSPIVQALGVVPAAGFLLSVRPMCFRPRSARGGRAHNSDYSRPRFFS
jgi:hypothetical protein